MSEWSYGTVLRNISRSPYVVMFVAEEPTGFRKAVGYPTMRAIVLDDSTGFFEFGHSDGFWSIETDEWEVVDD